MTESSAGLPPAPPDPVPPTSGPVPHAPAAEPRPLSHRRPRWLLPVAGLALIALLSVATMWRRPVVRPATAPVNTAPTAVAPPVLAETMGEEGHLSIAVVSLDRVAGDTVELRLSVTNTAAAGSPALDIAQRFSADGPDRGTLAEVYLADLSHERKFFVLRDGQNAPLGSRDDAPLPAGERRVLWARYPAPGDSVTEVVVHVPHAEPMPNVPVGVRTAAENGSPTPP